MNSRPFHQRPLIVIAALAATVVGCSKDAATSASTAPAPGTANNVDKQLCAVLKQIAPPLSKSPPPMAKAQFAGNLYGAFDNSATMIPELLARSDEIASKNCPAERELVLRATETSSLHDALN
jgi:hypothetical protein